MTFYADLTSWKCKVVSAAALIMVNLMYILIYFCDLSAISVIAYFTLVGLAGSAVFFYGIRLEQFECPDCMKPESIAESTEQLANSQKETILWCSRYFLKVFTWECYRHSITVGLVAYFILYLSDYLSLLFITVLKIDIDFILGAKKDEIDALTGPYIGKAKELACTAYEKIPRASVVKKSD